VHPFSNPLAINMAMQMLTYPSIVVSVSMVNNPQVVNTQWTVDWFSSCVGHYPT
jgi:hypothetical protein